MAIDQNILERIDSALDNRKTLKSDLLKLLNDLRWFIRESALLAYEDEVVSTGMENLIIGDDKEYADKEDWIDAHLLGVESLKDDSGSSGS